MMIKQTKLDESRVEEGNLQFVSCIFSKIIQRRNNNLFHAPRFKTLTFLSIEESIGFSFSRANYLLQSFFKFLCLQRRELAKKYNKTCVVSQWISRVARDDNASSYSSRVKMHVRIRGEWNSGRAISIFGPASPSCETPSSRSGRDKLCNSLAAFSVSFAFSFSFPTSCPPAGEVFRWNGATVRQVD